MACPAKKDLNLKICGHEMQGQVKFLRKMKESAHLRLSLGSLPSKRG
jgi:hypothetical protein